MEWYYTQNNEQRGPVSETELGRLRESGQIDDATMVWREGWSDWRKFSDATSAVATLDGNVPCVECGRKFPTSEMIQYEASWICAECKPVFFQKIKEGVAISADMTYGGFWIRFVAKFLDGIILQIVSLPLRFIFNGASKDPAVQMKMALVGIAVSMVITAAYQIFFLGKFGATPGKMALRLKVVTSSGGKISYARACGRYFAEVLSSIILCIGYIMAAFDDEKRTLHDRICDTRVIRLNA